MTSGRRDFLNPLKAIQAFREEASEGPAPDGPMETAAYGIDEESLIYAARPAMACQFQVFFPATSGPTATETAVEALNLVEHLEDQMTVYRDSPMTYVNQQAAHEPVRVEPNLFRLLQTGVELYRKTEGAFDITSGLLTRAWGFFRKQGRVPDQNELQNVLRKVGSEHIHLHPDELTVQFDIDGLEINLGGIGKGHAVDRIADFMSDYGQDDFLIHGGQSSVLARGWRFRDPRQESSGSPWKVGLRHPLHVDRRFALFLLKDRALGTSGTARQSFYHRGKRYGHIIDPRNGMPAEGVYSATALAPTAAEADALATAFYVMGGQKAVEFCLEHPQYACLVLSPGKSGEIRVDCQGIKDDEIEFPAPDSSSC